MFFFFFFFFKDTATTEIYTLSLHDALPISLPVALDNYGFQPSGVPVNMFRHFTKISFPVFADFGQDFHRGNSLVPFRVKYAVVRLDLADYAPVDYLIIYAALPAACGGRTVFYFDRCHSLYFCRLD